MPDLLFISDAPKMEQVTNLLQPMLKLEIRVTADVGRAIEDILNHPPAIICIQEQIAGTKAVEIVGHIRTSPGNAPPLLVLLRERDDTAEPPEQLFAYVIDLNLPVEEFVKCILRAVLQPAFKLRWNEICPSCALDCPEAPPKDETEPDKTPATPATNQIPSELLKAFEHNYRSRRRGRWMKLAAVTLTACLAVVLWYRPSRNGQNDIISSPLPAQQTTQLPAAPKPSAHQQVMQQPSIQRPAAQQPAPQQPAPQQPVMQRPAMQRPTAQQPLAAPVPLALKKAPAPAPAPAASAAAIALKAPTSPKATAASTAATFKLPSFIPKKGRDSAYPLHKPGWERYVGATREFRILRSGNRIKAVQVLATTPDAISDAYLKSVLGEISGTKIYRETSQDEDQGFLIKRGNAGPGAKVLIYTQNSRIRAFVISKGSPQ